MTRSTIFLLLILFSSTTFAQSQWLQTYGTEAGENYAGVEVAADGSFYMVGTFSDSYTIGDQTVIGEDYEFYLAKFDADGNLEWLKAETSAARYTPTDLTITSNGDLIICGDFDYGDAVFGEDILPLDEKGNAFIVKYDANGNVIWTHNELGASGYTAIEVDHNNNIVVSGSYNYDFYFNGELQPLYGEYDAFYAKYNATGQPQWIQVLPGLGFDDMGSISIDSDNNIVLTGRFGESFVFEGINFNSYGNGDSFIMKTDENGTPVWVNIIGSDGNDSEPGGLGIAQNGEIYMAMAVYNETYVDAFEISIFGMTDVCLMQINPDNGAVNWYRTGGSYDYDWVYGLVVGKEGVFMGGTYNSAADFGGLQLPEVNTSGYIVGYDFEGNAMQVVALTGGSFVTVYDLAKDKHGNLYTFGVFYDHLDVDGFETIQSEGEKDIFAYKLNSPLVDIHETKGANSFTIAPNPAIQELTIATATNTIDNISIINQLGVEIIQMALEGHQTSINIQQLPSGLYYVVIIENGVITSKPFIKQ